MTSWTVAYQAPLSVGFSRLEYWSGLPFPSPGDLPNPGIEPMSPALAGGFFTSEPPGKPRQCPSGWSPEKKTCFQELEKDKLFWRERVLFVTSHLHLSSWQFSGGGFLILTFHPKKLGFRKGR